MSRIVDVGNRFVCLDCGDADPRPGEPCEVLVRVTCAHCKGEGGPPAVWDEELCRWHVFVCPSCSGSGEGRAWERRGRH